MHSNNKSISDLESLISEKLCLRIEKWNLYLGDAGLSRKLAIECLMHLSNGSKKAAETAMDSIRVSIGDGIEEIVLSKFIIDSQKKDLENLLEDFI